MSTTAATYPTCIRNDSALTLAWYIGGKVGQYVAQLVAQVVAQVVKQRLNPFFYRRDILEIYI